MNILTFFLELYFAATLAVSGIAKVVNHKYFEQVLRSQRLMPSWSYPISSRAIPWLEIIVALFLLLGEQNFLASIIAVLFFVTFLGIKILLKTKGYSEDCGCYGTANKEDVDASSIVVSAIIVLLSFLHLYLIVKITSIDWHWHLFATALFVCIGAFIFIKVLVTRNTSPQPTTEPFSSLSGIDINTKAPDFEGIDQHGQSYNFEKFQGQPYALAFVMPGCSGCNQLFETLKRSSSHLKHFTILALSSAPEEINKEYAESKDISIPLLTVNSELIRDKYQVHGFPLVFFIDEFGIVKLKAIVNTENHLLQFLNQTTSAAV